MRPQALQDELERLEPTINPDLNQAEQLLSNFSEFWKIETAPTERRRLLLNLFEQVWQDQGEIVAVKPRSGVAPYFQALAQTAQSRPGLGGVQSGSDGIQAPSGHRIEIRL